MTGILFDLNTLTKHVDDLTQEAGQTKKQYVQDVYTSRDPYYVKKILELSEKVNLIESNDENISLKEDGKNLLEKFTERDGQFFYNPNSTQIEFLKEKFLAGEQFPEEFRNILQNFWSDFKNAELVCKLDSKTHELDKYVLAYLKEIQIFVVKETNGIIEIRCNKNLEEISKIKHHIKQVSDEDVQDQLKIKREIGKQAEKLAIDFEKNRLQNDEDRIDLALDIKQISLTDAYAGFDLKSYQNKDSVLRIHDRMIEVKGTTGTTPRFYWSSNEVKRAQEYHAQNKGERYWIYLYTNVKSDSRKLIRIKNPFKKFFEDTSDKPTCTGYFLDHKIIGDCNDE